MHSQVSLGELAVGQVSSVSAFKRAVSVRHSHQSLLRLEGED